MMRDQVSKRDEHKCSRCGTYPATDNHHRQRRAVGGHRLSNLILLCRLCHGWVHANPQAARDAGWIVAANGSLNPELVPVKRWTAEFGLQWYCLDDSGAAWILNPEAARKRFAFLGMDAA